MRWLDVTLPTIEANLALDEALLIEAEESGAGPALRVWEFPEFAVVLGASRRIGSDVDVEACVADGVAIARRSSGGGTVLIGPGALNLTVVLPIDSDPQFAAVDVAQKAILGGLGDEIRRLGVAVEVVGSGDLAVGGRKVSGSAQRRLRRNLMVHASILDAFPIARVGRYLRTPDRQPAYRNGRDHAAFLANLGLGRSVLVGAARRAYLGPAGDFEPVEVPGGLVDGLIASKFGAPGWVDRL